MNKSLFHIQQEYLQLAEILEDNGGELTPEIEQSLAINQQELQTKGVNYALVIRQIDGEAEIIDREIKRLADLKKTKENAANRMKEAIKGAMELYGIQSIKGDLINITLRNNASSVVINEEEKLPTEYVQVKHTISPDKKAIKAAIESGIEVPGAYLTKSKSILIK